MSTHGSNLRLHISSLQVLVERLLESRVAADSEPCRRRVAAGVFQFLARLLLIFIPRRMSVNMQEKEK
jgi:hypothetical protein